MSVVQTLIGNVKGPKGDTGATGATGASGSAATITVGSTTTTAYGNAASVTNSGTSSAAVFDFVIPQGKPGEATTKMGDLLLDSITSSAADFPSPQVGDTGKTAFGKIVKFFADTIAKFTQHESNMATISTSPTTRAFTAGEYLVYNSQLYQVTSNIANGGTLTVGTNITATSAGDQLKNMPHRVTSATANSSKTLAFSTNSMNVIWTAGSGGDNQAACFIVNTGTGSTIFISDVKTATQVSHTSHGLNVTIANSNTGNGLRICCLNLYGSFPTEA